jgi:PAS domain S-box-containing protein
VGTSKNPEEAQKEPPGELGQHQLIDLAFDAMFTRAFDDGSITSWNEGAESLYGWTRREALGSKAAELLCSEYPIPMEEIERELTATGRWEGEVLQCRKDGSQVKVNCRWGLQTDSAGNPLAILEINSDLSLHRQTSERLLRSEERFKLLVSAVVEYAIFMLDLDGNIVTWNEGAERIKGYSAYEIIGKHFSTFYTPEDRASNKPARALHIAATEGMYKEEGWRVRKDGSRFFASVVITALHDDEGILRGFGKVTRDITGRHEEDERLRSHSQQVAALEQSKTQFLDLAAHELRTPLTLIRGYNSLLEGGQLPPERVREIAGLLEGKLEDIDALVERMLEMSRLDNNRLELDRQNIDLLDLTQDQLAKFQPMAGSRKLKVTDKSASTLVMADMLRVSTIIGNLIDNAIKYSPDGSVIECDVGSVGSNGYVSIRDEGPGIAPEHVDLLFKRFSRLPTAANKKIHGTGLALYLCREIARRHGGDLSVRSEPGKGSEFTLTLPLAARGHQLETSP